MIVSVIIPCYNEEQFIGKTLENLAHQYDAANFEIILIDGRSEDRTREVITSFTANHPQLNVILLDNPSRHIPVALNIGIEAARGDIIARMDAHAVPSPEYIRRCVKVLEQDNIGVVGMPCRVRPGASSLTARAVAAAVSHPFGIGDAKYRLTEGTSPQEAVDTVAFACFRKSLWMKLKGFNETLLTNEDYDFNYRVRLTGQQVILDRGGHCDYFARTTLKRLAEQYWRYGGWKAQMLKLHPRSLKLRHLVAPSFVLSMIFLALLSLIWKPMLILLGLIIGSYALLSMVFGWQVMRRNQDGIGMLFIMPFVFLTIHLSWGTSFLLGLVRRPG
jgi:succinoglycan biosynthesis protein ExoA